MATKTREDLIRRSLREIGVLASGQTITAEDNATVDDDVDPMLADLAARGVYTGAADPDQIPDEAYLHLAIILGQRVAGQFGLQRDLVAEKEAEKALRRLDPVEVVETLQALYF